MNFYFLLVVVLEMFRIQNSFDEYIANVSRAFRSHLNLSFRSLWTFIFLLIAVFVAVFVTVKLFRKMRRDKYYSELFNKLCSVHGLSIEEKMKLNIIADLLNLESPVLLFIQPKRWAKLLSDQEINYLYKKLF